MMVGNAGMEERLQQNTRKGIFVLPTMKNGKEVLNSFLYSILDS